jgi:hypothetical protein
MPTLVGANRAFCGEFQTKVGMPAGSALRLPCRRRHGNRFLIVACRRVRLLPEGGNPKPLEGTGLQQLLAATLQHTDARRQVTLAGDARELWWHAYPQLTQPHDGLAGHITARAEAHVIRLALTYALLDGAPQIRAEHLHAALALWDYTSRSARWALRQATGDPLADQLHAALIRAPDGLTRTQLSHHVHRNLPAEQLDRALQALAAAGRARRTRINTGGRPAERWHANIRA